MSNSNTCLRRYVNTRKTCCVPLTVMWKHTKREVLLLEFLLRVVELLTRCSPITVFFFFQQQYQVGQDGRLMSLREQQVIRLQREIAHQAGVRLTLRKKDCLNTVAFVNIFNHVCSFSWRSCTHLTRDRRKWWKCLVIQYKMLSAFQPSHCPRLPDMLISCWFEVASKDGVPFLLRL